MRKKPTKPRDHVRPQRERRVTATKPTPIFTVELRAVLHRNPDGNGYCEEATDMFRASSLTKAINYCKRNKDAEDKGTAWWWAICLDYLDIDHFKNKVKLTKDQLEKTGLVVALTRGGRILPNKKQPIEWAHKWYEKQKAKRDRAEEIERNADRAL